METKVQHERIRAIADEVDITSRRVEPGQYERCRWEGGRAIVNVREQSLAVQHRGTGTGQCSQRGRDLEGAAGHARLQQQGVYILWAPYVRVPVIGYCNMSCYAPHGGSASAGPLRIQTTARG